MKSQRYVNFTEIAKCQSEAVYIMYDEGTTKVRSRYGAGLDLSRKKNEDN